MADDLRPDLDQLLPDRRQRPVLHLLWQRQRRHEIGEIVGRGVKLKPNLVVAVPSNLTNREREVFGLVSGGHTSKAIAHQLDITVKTIEAHRPRMMEKLGATARVEAAGIIRAAEKR